MTELEIRRADEADLTAIVTMLADDPLGAQRETPQDLTPYRRAFAELAGDPRQHLMVAVRDGEVVGSLQLTLVPGLTRTAMTRGLIEGVRVRSDIRGMKLGSRLIGWAVDEARRLGCGIVQLTTDLTRTDAHRFYESLGFTRSHAGYKLDLS